MPVAQHIDISIGTADDCFVGERKRKIISFHQHVGWRVVDLAEFTKADTILRPGNPVIGNRYT
jgi:hypothetical protein